MIAAAEVMVNGEDGLSLNAVRRIVAHVLHAEQGDAVVSITFLGPEAMRQLNSEHKGHDTPTDVLSFALPQPDGGVAGDIYICRFVAAREARSRGIPVRQELVRLVVHGLLHTLGHDHPEGDGREDSAMWQSQERHVEALT